MMETSRAEARRIQDIAFQLFAVIGFLSSIVTIIAWLTSSSASLTAVVTEKAIEVPEALQLSRFNSEKYNIGNAIDDLQQKYCNPVVVDYNGEKTKNYSYNQETCDSQKGFFSTIEKISSLDGKPLVAYDVKLTNDGTSVAENVKVRMPIDAQASAFDEDGNPVRVLTQQPQRLFILPDLNPNEVINMRLISSTPVKKEYEDAKISPSITFSGGKANYRNFIYISGRYSELIKFLDYIPIVFQILLILFGAFVITMIWLVPLTLLSDWAERSKNKGPVLITADELSAAKTS